MGSRMSPAGRLLRDILDDCEWHDYENLTGWIVASGVLNGKHAYRTNKQGVREPVSVVRQVRILIKALARSNSYEAKVRSVGKRHYLEAVRRKPRMKLGATLKSCTRCGAPDLEVTERVRRVQEYRIPRSAQRIGQSGMGDLIAAKFPTQYLCVPCATHELEVSGSQWRLIPPFDYSSGEVRRDTSTVNPAGYIRPRNAKGVSNLPEEGTGKKR